MGSGSRCGIPGFKSFSFPCLSVSGPREGVSELELRNRTSGSFVYKKLRHEYVMRQVNRHFRKPQPNPPMMPLDFGFDLQAP